MTTGEVATLERNNAEVELSAGAYRPAVTGPFTEGQLTRIADALAAADGETDYHFSVFVGDLDGVASGDLPATTVAARTLHARLPNADDSVLLAVSPNQRLVEIVTGANSGQRLTNRACAMVTLSAVTAFAGGDLAGGIVTALRMLADRAR